MTLRISKIFFLILVVSLPLVRPFNFDEYWFVLPYTDLLFLLSFSFWTIALIRGETTLKFDKFYIFLALYAFTLSISTVFSVNPNHSFIKLLGEFYLFLLAVLTINLIRDRPFFKQVVYAWLAGTVLTILASVAGVALFYFGYKSQDNNYFLSRFGSLPSGNFPRVQALFLNSNMMSNFLNVSLLFVLLAEKLQWLKKPFSRALQIGVWVAGFLTLSAGLGGMFLSFLLWHWVFLKKRRKTMLSRASLAAGILAAMFFLTVSMVSPDTPNTEQECTLPGINQKVEVSVRVLIWENTITTYLGNPWIGRGTGMDVADV